jgi:SAM-dependent methyltransferase
MSRCGAICPVTTSMTATSRIDDTGPEGVVARGTARLGAENRRSGKKSDATASRVTETMVKREAAPELVAALEGLPPGKALDLACGSGRHTFWLAERGWEVTAVDIETAVGIPHSVQADLERHEYAIEPDAWDLIVCWLYWQPDLLPEIARGVRHGGFVALAGKTTGRFATSLAQYRAAFEGWVEMASGENETRVFFVARRARRGEKLID